VVFDSAVPGFFLTHYDLVPPLSDTTNLAPGPTGLPPLVASPIDGLMLDASAA